MNSTDTEGTINITIANTPLEVPSDSHPFFSQFSEWCPRRVKERKRTLTRHRYGIDRSCVSVSITPRDFFADVIGDLSSPEFRLIGHARAIANLSIGQLTLNPINFNVTSNLDGLRGLQNDTIISSVDVVGGTHEAILLAINGKPK